jgi:ceramide glucosyltransferase
MQLPDIALAGAATMGAIYHGVTSLLLHRHFARMRGPHPGVREVPPVTFLRPVKPGVPDLRGKIRRLMESARTGDQILAGVETDGDADACAGVPGVEVVRCGSGHALNPKINKLLQMTPHALHDRWIVTDCEALPDAAFLETVRAEWLDADCVTAGYFFVNATSLSRQLDGASALLTLWPGLMLAPVRFVLGACFAVKRADVEACGGWRAFADFLHEDNRLGSALAHAGRRIVLSRAVLPLEADEISWRDWWRHQLRVALTYRVSSPVGWLGMPLTYSPAWALAFALLDPGAAWRWLAPGAALAIRYFTARLNAGRLRCPGKYLALSVVAQSFCEPVWWCASWCLHEVRWGARRYRVTRDGRIRDLRSKGRGQSR